jgi:glyoxylase I family protein
MLKIQSLDHITITSRDPLRSVSFYRDIFGLQPVYEWPGEITMLRCGDTYLAIAWWQQGKGGSEQPPITVDHYAFRVTAETFSAAKTELARHGVRLDHESDHGICQSVYFRDPDGHLVELTCYELQGGSAKMPIKLCEE